MPSASKLAAPIAVPEPQTAITGVNCTGSWSYYNCRKDSNSTVFLSYKVSDAPAALQPTLDASLDTFIGSVIDIFKKYYDGGQKFTQANISNSRTVTIKISSSYKEPEYSPKTGNIYVGWGVVQGISGATEYCTLAHEIMHWIQDEQYPMNINAASNIESWWIEMTAMYGAFFYNTACINTTITTYGSQAVADKRRAYQAEPFKWASGEDARYLQGIQFYLGVCSGTGCALNETDLINAVNAGSYPYDGTKQAAYNLLAKETGLYMLGEPPTQGNTSAPIPPTYQTGGTYFEEMIYKPDNPTAPFTFPSDTGNTFTQVSPMKATVSSKINLGGEYPLYIGNGDSATNKPGLPGMVRIVPGSQFWTKLSGQTAVFHDGTSEVLLGPLGKLGNTSLMVIAVAPSSATTLSATYEVADLSGDWGASHKSSAIISSNCSASENNGNPDEFLADDPFMGFISGFGTYVLDPAKPDGSHYIWQGSVPLPTTEIISDVTVLPEKVVLKYSIHIPKPTSSTMPLWGLGLVGSVGVLCSRKQKRINLILALLILLPLILAGCEGFAMYGDVNGEYTFTKITYTDPKTNPGTTFPWSLEGVGMIDEALSIDVKDIPCHTVYDTTVTARVGAADSIQPPSIESDTVE